MIRGFSLGTVTFLENQCGQGLRNVIVIVIIRKLIPKTKIVACNHSDDEGKSTFTDFFQPNGLAEVQCEFFVRFRRVEFGG